MSAMMTVALLLALAPSFQSGPWQQVGSMEATGYERVLTRPRHTFTARRSGGLLAIEAARAIDGQLEGDERVEAAGPKGVFTWLKLRPDWVLQLPGATLSDLACTVTPARYTPDEVLSDRARIERMLGMPIALRGEDTVAGRACQLVHLGSERAANAALQKVWLDKETGATLRRLDLAGASQDYELQVTDFETGSKLAETRFAPGARARVVRGVVCPEVLRFLGDIKVWTEYNSEMDGLRQSSTGGWLRRLPDPSTVGALRSFSYVSTVNRGVSGTPANPQETTRIGFVDGKPIMMAGDLPPGYRLAVESGENGQFTLALVTPNGPGPRITMRSQGSGEGTATITMSVVASGPTTMSIRTRTDPSGALIVEPMLGQGGPGMPPVPPGPPGPRGRRVRIPPVWAQSDFVDRRTGDSVSFLQARGRTVISLLSRFALPASTPVDDQQLGRVLVYKITKPYAVTVVAWATPEAQFALASTRLSADELRQVAAQTRTSR